MASACHTGWHGITLLQQTKPPTIAAVRPGSSLVRCAVPSAWSVRHSYATAGLANATGWHEIKVISQRLGRASVGITLDTYSHVLPAADEQTAHTLARVILGD